MYTLFLFIQYFIKLYMLSDVQTIKKLTPLSHRLNYMNIALLIIQCIHKNNVSEHERKGGSRALERD